jgi:hypothetical protein
MAVKTLLNSFHASCVAAFLVAPPAHAAPGAVFRTSVAPRSDEDLASDCLYEITLLDRSRPVRAVWVIFDRGRDMLRHYGDPTIQAFAHRHDVALLLAFHCRAKSDEDINVDPAKGIGRALLTALTQMAESSGHAELASAKLILLGFSGAGSLVGRLPEYAPDRVLAVMATNAGHFDPLGVDTITLSPRAAAVPQLILTGGADAVSGTQRPYEYFRKYFDQGAPWTFVVQNKMPHCCVINAKALMLEWLDAVVVRGLTRKSGWYGFIKTAPSQVEDCPNPRPALVPPYCHSTKDTWGSVNWSASAATIDRRPIPPQGMMPAGWLPTSDFARQWASFVRQPEHPEISMP